MNVVDSSGWLEYFADGTNARHFAKPIELVRDLLVPSLSIAEVFKRVLTQRGEDSALQVVAAMQQGKIVELDVPIAIMAAKLGAELRLPLADSIMLASARAHHAVLWTQDSDFKDVENVKYFPKRY